MKIGKHFTLEELTKTKSGLPNKPNLTEQQALSELVKNILDPLRDMYDHPINVNSGYRSKAVNIAANNGKDLPSQHCRGEAADIDTDEDNALLFRLIRDNFTFDQLIWEGGDDLNPAWVHVSYRADGKNRKQKLRMKVIKGNKKYLPL